MGGHNKDFTEESNYQDVKVGKIANHPAFHSTPLRYENDIAILYLERDVEYTGKTIPHFNFNWNIKILSQIS